MLHLEHTATLIQKIHFPEYIIGYQLYLHPSGDWTSSLNTELAVLHVEADTIKLIIHSSHVYVNETIHSLPAELILSGDTTINFRTWSYRFIDYRKTTPSWWPYFAKLTIPPILSRFHMNQSLNIGRKKGSEIILPSNAHCDNIFWHSELTYLEGIPTSSGTIPKNRFATDMINVSSHHGTLSCTESHVILKCDSTQCPIFVCRYNQMITLSPNHKKATSVSCTLQTSDDILIGNHCFNVSRLPDSTAPPPAKRLRSAQETDHSFFDEIPVSVNSGGMTTSFSDRILFKSPPSNVVVLQEQDWKDSLQSNYRIQVLGWILNGELKVGNHSAADICIPENQFQSDQQFKQQDYLQFNINHQKGTITLHDSPDIRLLETGDELEDYRIAIFRKSNHSSKGFHISLNMVKQQSIPSSMLLHLDRRNDTTNSMFSISIAEELNQIVQICQHTCQVKMIGNSLEINPPSSTPVYSKINNEWFPSTRKRVLIKPSEMAVVGSVLIRFIHDESTFIVSKNT